jgi:uncharacterized protein (TIGR03437 family)
VATEEVLRRLAKTLTIHYHNGLSFERPSYSVAQRWRRSNAAGLHVRAFLAAGFLFACPCGFSAALSLANQTANSGQTVVASVLLAAEGQAVAGIQFDIQWDQTLAVQVGPAIAPGQSFKVLYTSSPTPGVLRCLIVGANQNSLADGAMIQLFVASVGGASPGVAQVSLTNAFATSATGDSIPIASVAASVQIQNGASVPLPAASVLNAASLLADSVSPGEIITILGLMPPSPTVLFNGVQAPLLYAGNGQLNTIVPFGLDVTAPADLQILSGNQTAAEGSIPVAAVLPAIFTQSGTGAGPGAVLNQDFSLNSFSNPAAADSVVMIYGTGFGVMQSPLTDGQIAGGAVPLAIPVTVTIGGMPSTVVYAGSAPGLIAGVTQINVQVPEGLPSGSSAPVVLSIGSATTPAGVTVFIR